MKRGMLLDGIGGPLDVLKTALSVFYSTRGKATDGAATAKCTNYTFRLSFLPASTPTLITFDDCLSSNL